MVTFNDINATLPGPLPHTPPLFHQLPLILLLNTTEYLKSMIIIQDMLIMVIFSLIMLGLIDLV